MLQSNCKQSLDILLEAIAQLCLSIPGTVVENQAQHILKIQVGEVSRWRWRAGGASQVCKQGTREQPWDASPVDAQRMGHQRVVDS